MDEYKGRILGIDYGQRRIGLAVSDPLGILATGLPTIVYQTLPDALDQIEKIISDYQVCEVVVGLPLNLKGEEGGAAQQTRRFIEELRKRLALAISVWDERFTSRLAQRTLKTIGKSPSRNREKIDKLSATLMLQNYLDKINSETRTIL
jgi:putative Holliday junction resolvase